MLDWLDAAGAVLLVAVPIGGFLVLRRVRSSIGAVAGAYFLWSLAVIALLALVLGTHRGQPDETVLSLCALATVPGWVQRWRGRAR